MMPSVADMIFQIEKFQPWSLDGFSVVPLRDNNDTELALVHLRNGSDSYTRHEAMVDLGKKLEKIGFTVSYFNFYGVIPATLKPTKTQNYVHNLQVSVIRAEDKLFWTPDGPREKDSPNFAGLLATGPLIRSEGMQPRRVVLANALSGVKEWVTHIQVIPDGRGLSCRPSLDSPRYWSDYGHAVLDFTTRLVEFDREWNPGGWK